MLPPSELHPPSTLLVFILCVSSAPSRRLEAPPSGYLAALLPSRLNHSVSHLYRAKTRCLCFAYLSTSFPRILGFVGLFIRFFFSSFFFFTLFCSLDVSDDSTPVKFLAIARCWSCVLRRLLEKLVVIAAHARRLNVP